MATGASFKLEISGVQNLNKFFNVIQFFSKIGKYLILEVDTDAVILRTLNDAKSAFASVEFDKRFFDHFELAEGEQADNQAAADIRQVFTCKVLIRPLCVVLRKAKKMQMLRMFNGVSSDGVHELSVVMCCEFDIRRCHRFIYQSCDIVSAMFDDEACNRLRVMPKVLTQLFGHIAKSIEVAVDVSTQQFKMKSFHQDPADSPLSASHQKRHTMTSEMCVDPDEFDLYEFRRSDEPQELAFCCKELRAILWLCEACDIPDLTFLFSEGGSPVKFACEDSSISCHLVMATLEPRGGDRGGARNMDSGRVSGGNRDSSEERDRSGEKSISHGQSSGSGGISDSRHDGSGSGIEGEGEAAARKKSKLHRVIMDDDDDD